MQPENKSPHTFIVRLWRERSEDRAFIWRGSVDNVQSGERLYFQSIERLKDVIAQMMEGKGDVPDASMESWDGLERG